MLSVIIVFQFILFEKNHAVTTEEITKSFENITIISIESVSGDLILTKSPDEKVYLNLTWDYEPEGSFDYRIETEEGRLNIEELFHGSSSGHSTWEFKIPDGLKIVFTSASGSANINYCSGQFNISSASGDITAEEVSLINTSSFQSASGDVEIILSDEINGDLNITSVSGDVILDFNGESVSGTLTVQIREDDGDLESDFNFDTEKTIMKIPQNSSGFEDQGKEKSFLVKSLQRNSGLPKIFIATEVGRAEIIK